MTTGPALIANRSGVPLRQGNEQAQQIADHELRIRGLETGIASVDREMRIANPVTALAAPNVGDIGYQDSNDSVEGPYWWHGSAWRRPWNMPWGIVAIASTTTQQTGIGTTVTDLTGLSVTFTAVANRHYRTNLFVRVQQLTSSATSFVIVTSGGNVQVQGDGHDFVTNGQHGFMMTVVETLAAGSHTRKGRAAAGANTMQTLSASTSPGVIVVEDIGPNGAPS